MANTVALVSLGCAKNQLNAEQMLFRLKEAGCEFSPEADNVDVVIINTCGFIDSAQEEAISAILDAAAKKAAGTVGKILVTGCLAQRYREQIFDELPEVDGILGTGSYMSVASAVSQLLGDKRYADFGDINAPADSSPRILSTPPYYAYISIAEGCDNRCSYCIIPKLRGKYRSRPMEDILLEARGLAERGVKELIVVAQDTSRYGTDLYGEYRLPELLRSLCKIDGFHWIRIHYLYPEGITDELLRTIAEEPKIVKYLDIPIQHVNDVILKKMNRRGNKAFLDEMFLRIREAIPGVVLRTSLICGLPYEDDAAFEELCEFLKKHRLERAGAFVFSPQEGTAAAKMPYPEEPVARRRAEIVTSLQMDIMEQYNESLLGTVLEILCEGYDEESGLYYGRSFADSPDVDGCIFFTSERNVAPGDFVNVFIGEISDGDPVGAEVRR